LWADILTAIEREPVNVIGAGHTARDNTAPLNTARVCVRSETRRPTRSTARGVIAQVKALIYKPITVIICAITELLNRDRVVRALRAQAVRSAHDDPANAQVTVITVTELTEPHKPLIYEPITVVIEPITARLGDGAFRGWEIARWVRTAEA
jgi:hypothetical protein